MMDDEVVFKLESLASKFVPNILVQENVLEGKEAGKTQAICIVSNRRIHKKLQWHSDDGCFSWKWASSPWVFQSVVIKHSFNDI